MTLCISCKTVKEIEVKYYVPEIDWPEFPKAPEYEKINGKIAVEENYFRQLLVFRELYKNEIKKYEEKKEMLEAQK